jgi:hypothetical protein
MAMRGIDFKLNVTLEIIHVCEIDSVSKVKKKGYLINFCDIVYATEEEKIQFTLNPSKLSLFLFCHEYIWVKFVLRPRFVTVMNIVRRPVLIV